MVRLLSGPLSRALGRRGNISGYLGESDVFDRAIADFSTAYADQTERDHAALRKAVRKGKLEVFDRTRIGTWTFVSAGPSFGRSLPVWRGPAVNRA